MELNNQDKERKRVLQHDLCFEDHLLFSKTCDSKNLLKLHSTLYDKYFRYEMLLLTFQGKEDTEHQDLLNAALNRDVKLAQKLLKNHIESAETYLMHAY